MGHAHVHLYRFKCSVVIQVVLTIEHKANM